nr:retrotransposon protein, putative, Ty1-copia subclass [Tanacetum cinerariifolium]
MAVVAQNTNNTTIMSILLAEKLTGSNFTNWYRNLRIVLWYEKKIKFVEQPIRPAPDPETADLTVLTSTMSLSILSKRLHVLCYLAKQELFEIVKAFHACKQEDCQTVSSYLLKMKSYLDTLERLGYAMPNELGALAELHAMLKLHEKSIPKKAETPAVLTIGEGKIQKDKKKLQGAKGKNKEKNKLAYAPKSKILPPPKRDMHNLYQNVSCSVYNVSNKKAKHALDSDYLWYCRLGHINKKRMDMLQCDGLLQPTHDESHEKCKSCISEKMARKPFPYQVEGAKDLLGLIHIDVCGPFRTVSREGANYFITFTNDFSRYGFVYLMKHKHEVFESFKVFQNEVENQLGKKIKSIQYDRGGEYLSHEFVNHMKSCGIVSQLTPPYTLQHNGVFERRNQTLLDMVRSMINLTTLPKYFWGYALETAARILNMVLTKNLDRTPYEIWHGKAPKSTRIPQVPNRYGYYVDIEEYELRDLDEPPNYKAVLADPESDKWLEGMNTEMQSMRDNQVWYLVDISSNGQTVGCKWLFKKKNDMDGNSSKDSLTIVAFYDYEIWQMDVKTAFLNGHLSEDVYMVQPKGFVYPKHPNKVCKLQCSIYGMKQASRSWNKRFDEEIKKIGFTQTPDEPCVYLKTSGSNVAFIVLYANDLLLMGNSITMLQEVKSWLCKCFSIKDLGEAACILRINIIRDRSKRLIALSQSAYLEKILKKFRMENSKKDMVLVYGAKPEDEMKVSCYADASFQTDKDDTKSQTGHMFVLNGGAVDWKSAKQSTTAMYYTEAEYLLLLKHQRKLSGWGNLLMDLKMSCHRIKDLWRCYRKYHYIREVIQEREIVLKKVHTYDNVADPFTKPMPFNKHFKHVMAIGIVPPSSLMVRSQLENKGTIRVDFVIL